MVFRWKQAEAVSQGKVKRAFYWLKAIKNTVAALLLDCQMRVNMSAWNFDQIIKQTLCCLFLYLWRVCVAHLQAFSRCLVEFQNMILQATTHSLYSSPSPVHNLALSNHKAFALLMLRGLLVQIFYHIWAHRRIYIFPFGGINRFQVSV